MGSTFSYSFFLAEEGLNRNINMLVNSGSLDVIKGASNKVPSHIYYADDMLILYKGGVYNIKSRVVIFKDYGAVSRQFAKCGKSSICRDVMTLSRLNILSDLTIFSIGSSSFLYLGVPIFKGRYNAKYLKPVADKIILKSASWKGSLLTFAGRVVLVKTSVQGVRIDWWRWVGAKYIPPSKSFTVWRLLLSKLSTDDLLKRRNFVFPLRCNLYFVE
ncbi:hypothetical protein KIW84_065953 [Lathyrus oleraceus]|uniref:Reverse transcriptase zinc-binding domain-containing protein n=1 Tax=Pisum sativum TaxID=3888 RepID=A0A9D5AD48_PEA|nr:hypothetical protein KIW84_065953 [Pisum sativum]